MVRGNLQDNSGVVKKDKPVARSYPKSLSIRDSGLIHLFDELDIDMRKDLINYLDRMELVSDSGVLVIPSARHYFYNAEDLKGIKTVINLKRLNHVRDIRNFLRKISDLLPNKSNLVGCFVDSKIQKSYPDKYSNLSGNPADKTEAYENGIESKVPFINRMYSFIDLRPNRYLTRRAVIHYLEESGLELLGMTELKGLTYFCAQKIKPAL
jgi:hypothetical protein